MDLRKRLLELKNRAGMTTEALSEASGVPRGTINKLLNGETRNPTAQTLQRLSRALGCAPGELYEPDVREGCPFGRDVGELMRRGELMPPKRRRVPLIGEIAAGRPLLCDQTSETVEIGGGEHCDFALRVDGDSMIGARIRDGDIVFIHAQDDVDDGQIAAVIIDDHATLKRVYHVANGLQLLSENPVYPPMLFTYPEHEVIRILGRAVGFQSTL